LETVTLKAKELETIKEELPSTSKITELEKKLKDTETISSVKTLEAKFSIHRDNMLNAYNELLKVLTALDRTDREVKEKYRENVSTILENMGKMAKEWPPAIQTNLAINSNQSKGK